MIVLRPNKNISINELNCLCEVIDSQKESGVIVIPNWVEVFVDNKDSKIKIIKEK